MVASIPGADSNPFTSYSSDDFTNFVFEGKAHGELVKFSAALIARITSLDSEKKECKNLSELLGRVRKYERGKFPRQNRLIRQNATRALKTQ